eukprot:6506403-Karenia_brevis.AAC.1
MHKDYTEDVRGGPRANVRRFAMQQNWENHVWEGTKTIEGRICHGAAALVSTGDRIVLGTTQVLVSNVCAFATFSDLLSHYGLTKCLPGVRSLRDGIRIYHAFRNYAELEPVHGVVAWEISIERSQRKLHDKDLNHEQMSFVDEIRKQLQFAFAIYNAVDEIGEQQLIDAKFRQGSPKILICEGPPGCGKTAALYLAIDEVLESDGHVLFAVYTAQLASRVRVRFQHHPRKRNLHIDTCHAAFGLDQPLIQMPLLARFQLIVVDEYPQLTMKQSDHILSLHQYIKSINCLCMAGDRWQMA